MICEKCGFKGTGKSCSNCGGKMTLELTAKERESLSENAGEYTEELTPTRLDLLMKKVMLAMIPIEIVLSLLFVREGLLPKIFIVVIFLVVGILYAGYPELVWTSQKLKFLWGGTPTRGWTMMRRVTYFVAFIAAIIAFVVVVLR